MRFSEALAITPRDFDLAHQMISISKTWNYKEDGGFMPTKNIFTYNSRIGKYRY